MFEKFQTIKAQLAQPGWHVEAGFANGRPVTVVMMSRRWEFPAETPAGQIVTTVREQVKG